MIISATTTLMFFVAMFDVASDHCNNNDFVSSEWKWKRQRARRY